ncbi:CaiB/BaiF CoA transferase family protein [Falsiroseomonas ponticola]|jgi:crotonobetainyl-CoA:carnitine CoA-transferase CaiB-like acyl-CoA transferase|uniref:CaiB/BaiF CoA transferase family protein n=1 Tax=Falsiroseomonas ponticola TaxID=2786951 RepID=UPI0019312214|nr:CaiB/BaiF CoA-transferase family protein [Roseomonas ponticola]
MEKAPSGPLRGLRVLDLTRVLAGPTCTQMLGDMGAEVIKIERPESGDDTRGFAPPVWPGTEESAYFLGVNRNKKSLTLDIAKEEGQAIIHQLLETCDILVENFKVGALAKYGLGYDQLKLKYPGLIYCSITGFGQTGPYAPRPGYDALIQGMGGVMSLTGEPEGLPQKVGVPVADLFAGLYGCIGILAALRHRERTGQGQQIDIGMLDTSVAWLANQGMNYLATGENPPRLGNQHPNIAPYQVFPTKDGHIVLSVGNDPTFERFCKSFGCEAMLADPRFATNAERVANRDAVTAALTPVMQSKTTAEWVAALEERKIGCGPINKLSDVFADPHVKARGCTVDLTLSNGANVTVIANPVRLSATPADYRIAPPLLGEHSEEVLTGLLGMTEAEVQALKDKGVV